MMLLVIIILATLIRLYELSTVPGEVWGDVITHYQLVLMLLSEKYFLAYPFFGDGPFFSYFAAFMTLFFGLSFFTLKLTTVIAGVVLTTAVYFLAKEYFNKREVSLMASFLTAVSFWSISFSRQAKPHIFVPVFIVLTLIFALKRKNVFSGIFLGLGMYVQAGFWGMMMAMVTNIRAFAVGLLVALPVLTTFYFRSTQFFGSTAFYGEKLGGQYTLIERVTMYGENVVKNVLSFYWQGDIVFRHNIPKYPHIDLVSAVFFTFGIVFIIWASRLKAHRKLIQYFLIPFVLIQIPSIADISNELSVPNMGRMIGIMPLVYIAVAYGISQTFAPLRKFFFHKFFLGFFLGLIMTVNLYNYFIIYPRTLPNENVAFGKIIAEYINERYENPLVFMSGCCWGDWGQPEPNGIKYSLTNPEKMQEIKTQTSADDICFEGPPGEKVVFVVDPRQTKEFKLPTCVRRSNVFMLREHEMDVGWIIEGELR